jgi:hypothetical protein
MAIFWWNFKNNRVKIGYLGVPFWVGLSLLAFFCEKQKKSSNTPLLP